MLRAYKGLHVGLPLRVLLIECANGRAADDQRRSRLIDEDGVHFVDYGEIVPALDLLLLALGHAVIAQVIETELGIGAVSDVAGVLLAAQTGILAVQDATDGEPQKFVQSA